LIQEKTPAIAASKKQDTLKRYGVPLPLRLAFLTGPAESINALTNAVGFQYQYDPKINQLRNATAIMVLTPQGPYLALLLRCGLSPEKICVWAWWQPLRARSATPSTPSCYCLSLRSRHRKIRRDRQQHFAFRSGSHIGLLAALLFILMRPGPRRPAPHCWPSTRTHTRRKRNGEPIND